MEVQTTEEGAQEGEGVRKLPIVLARYHTVHALEAVVEMRLGPGSLEDAEGTKIPRGLQLSQVDASKGIVFKKDSDRFTGQFFVKTLHGKTLTFEGSNVSTVADLKRAIFRMEGIPDDQQRLIFAGKQLEDERILTGHGIGDGAILHLVSRMRGDWVFEENRDHTVGPMVNQVEVLLPEADESIDHVNCG